ncbi:MAG: hypothetical protein R3D01_01910 [Hyphomicrobiales bacterium]
MRCRRQARLTHRLSQPASGVALADSVLSRQGRMSQAVEHIGRGQLAEEGQVILAPSQAGRLSHGSSSPQGGNARGDV